LNYLGNFENNRSQLVLNALKVLFVTNLDFKLKYKNANNVSFGCISCDEIGQHCLVE